jgi:hypothetical protein
MRDKGDALGANYILIWESDLKIGKWQLHIKIVCVVIGIFNN